MTYGSSNQLPMGQQLGNFNWKAKQKTTKKGIVLKGVKAFLNSVYENTGFQISLDVIETIFASAKVASHSDAFSKISIPKDEKGGILKSFSQEELGILYERLHDGMPETGCHYATA